VHSASFDIFNWSCILCSRCPAIFIVANGYVVCEFIRYFVERLLLCRYSSVWLAVDIFALLYCPSVLWHCWLGHISLTRKIVSEMTYIVSSGTLNPTIPIPYLLLYCTGVVLPPPKRLCLCFSVFVCWFVFVCEQDCQKGWMNFHVVFGTGRPWDKKQWIRFWGDVDCIQNLFGFV